ncbi:MAG: hypothetical protein AAB817_00630 [Patescibacteria group bacterium]
MCVVAECCRQVGVARLTFETKGGLAVLNRWGIDRGDRPKKSYQEDRFAVFHGAVLLARSCEAAQRIEPAVVAGFEAKLGLTTMPRFEQIRQPLSAVVQRQFNDCRPFSTLGRERLRIITVADAIFQELHLERGVQETQLTDAELIGELRMLAMQMEVYINYGVVTDD